MNITHLLWIEEIFEFLENHFDDYGLNYLIFFDKNGEVASTDCVLNSTNNAIIPYLLKIPHEEKTIDPKWFIEEDIIQDSICVGHPMVMRFTYNDIYIFHRLVLFGNPMYLGDKEKMKQRKKTFIRYIEAITGL